MINRRSFLFMNAPAAALASATVLNGGSPAQEGKDGPSAVFELATLRLHFVQLDRMLGWIEKRAMPLFQKHSFGPVGVFNVEVGPHIPATHMLFVHRSVVEMDAKWTKLVGDADWTAAVTELEAQGPAYFREDFALLSATSFSPPLKPSEPGGSPNGIYELRIYESSTDRQHGFMHDRFAGGEIDVFHKCGIHPVLYADTMIGPNRPNMVYLTPFESEAHREKAWAAFRAHPDWKKLADDWLRRSGELARNISSSILVPTKFSMIR